MRYSLSVLIFSAFLLSIGANAALPPLSQEDREAYSSHIVTGLVVGISKDVREEAPGFIDNVFTVSLALTSVEKGEEVASGRRMNFTFWKAAERPEGLCGPMGQNGMIRRYTEIRAYVYKDEQGVFNLIEPNGFDQL